MANVAFRRKTIIQLLACYERGLISPAALVAFAGGVVQNICSAACRLEAHTVDAFAPAAGLSARRSRSVFQGRRRHAIPLQAARTLASVNVS